MDFNKLFESKGFKVFTVVLLAAIFILAIFVCGILVGVKKATFSYDWGENYHRNFGGPGKGFFKQLNPDDFMQGNGIFGQILKIENDLIVMKGNDNVEKAVKVGSETVIRKFKNNISLKDLIVNDVIVVIGEPNQQGQVEAKLIRVMPPLPQHDTSTAAAIPRPIFR